MKKGDEHQNDKFKERREKYQAQWEAILLDCYLRLLIFARVFLQNNSSDELKRNYQPADLVHYTVARILYYSINPENVKNKLAYQKQVLQNIVTDLIRKAGKIRTNSIDDENYSEAEMPTENPDPLKNVENEKMLKVIAKVSYDLSDLEKQIFNLYLSGYSRKEIAEMINRDIKVVEHKLNAVIIKIKYRIKHYKDE